VSRPTGQLATLPTGGLLSQLAGFQTPLSLPGAVGHIFVRTVKVRTAIKKRCEECYFGGIFLRFVSLSSAFCSPPPFSAACW